MANTLPPVPPRPGATVNEFVADRRAMTEHKAMGAALGGAVAGLIWWWLWYSLLLVGTADSIKLLIAVVLGAVLPAAAAYIAPRNRFKLP
jgi:hypothetical protein